MASNLDQLLFTKADFASFREMSANITDAKVDSYILEAQTVECRGFLGQELWTLMQQDFDGVGFLALRFSELWFGVDYTNYAGVQIRFNGYVNAGIYFAYGRFLNQQQVNISRFGVESIQNEISEDITNAQIRDKARNASQMAFAFQNDALKYLESNQNSFPEFNFGSNAQAKKTSFNFFKV
jgi:hypothetical protein